MTRTVAPRTPLRTIALPNEHGAWGSLLEPALLGALLAPSLPGFALIVSAFALVLLQNPLSLTIADKRRRRIYPRTRLAFRFVLIYSIIALCALAVTLWHTESHLFLVPALLAAPLALLKLLYDTQLKGRELLPELCGAAALGALVAAIALVGGWSFGSALMLWLLLLARTVPSILYVRARLRLEQRSEAKATLGVMAGLWAFLGVLALAMLGFAPALAIFPFLILFLRGALGLSRHRRPAKAATVGFREFLFGLVLVLFVAGGYALGL